MQSIVGMISQRDDASDTRLGNLAHVSRPIEISGRDIVLSSSCIEVSGGDLTNLAIAPSFSNNLKFQEFPKRFERSKATGTF